MFQNRDEFLTSAGLFEAALIPIALLLGWIFAVNPVATLDYSLPAIAYGLLAAVPLFIAFLAVEQLPIEPVQKIQETVINSMGKFLAQCSWLELLLLATLAGIGEEVLFRGFLLVGLEAWLGYWPAVVLSSIAFGLLHAVTITYTIFASLAGIYFAWVFDFMGERNLLAPVLCHAFYDFLAFLMILYETRKEGVEQEEVTQADEFPW